MADTTEPKPKIVRKKATKSATNTGTGVHANAGQPADQGTHMSQKSATPLESAASIASSTAQKVSKQMEEAAAAAAATAKATFESASTTMKAQADGWREQAEQVKEQATKTARTVADTAKDKTGATMQGLAKLINDSAETVDSKMGSQYGDYARKAAEAVAGAAKSLDAKDVDQLVDEARDFVKKSPAVAIGAAAVLGFVLMRLAKGSGNTDKDV